MAQNPVLKNLGFSENDRVVVIHADDVAISQSSIDAYLDLMNFGTISCGSAMPPTHWFPELARIVTENPKLDMGLHLPVTSEHQAYRWRPVSNAGPESGLVDDCGYFHPGPAAVGNQAAIDSVIDEFEAQIQLSLKLGLTPTHLDNHHAISFLYPRFLEPFLTLAFRYKILPIIMRLSALGVAVPPAVQAASAQMGQSEILAKTDTEIVDEIASAALEEGYPVPDYIAMLPLKGVPDRLALAKKMISFLKPGLTHFVIHPMKDTPETRAITPSWPSRVGDYEVFMTKELKYHLVNEGVQLIGYRTLAEAVFGR